MFDTDGFQGTDSYSGLRLEVMGQYQAQMYVPGDDEVCISISSAGHGVRVPALSDEFKAIHRVTFDDTAVDRQGDPDAKTITRFQAADVAKFIVEHRHKKKIVIHCFAGMSRSRSMAAAIAEALSLPYHYTVLNWSVFNAIRDAMERMLEEAKGQ